MRSLYYREPFKGEGSSHCRIRSNKCLMSFLCHLGRPSLPFLFLFHCRSSSASSFPLHPTSGLSIPLPLIIPYLYLGPFGSQRRYLACSDWAETPPNLITQSVGQGMKEVATPVSLRTVYFSLSLSLSLSFSLVSTLFLSFSLSFHHDVLLRCSGQLLSLPVPRTFAALPIFLVPFEGGKHWHWGIKPLPIRL